MLVSQTEGKRLCMTRTDSWHRAFLKTVLKKFSAMWEEEFMTEALGLEPLAVTRRALQNRHKYEE